MTKIKVDIDELMETVEEIKEDDYTTVELSIDGDGYYNELSLAAISIEEPDPVPYGTISEVRNEFE